MNVEASHLSPSPEAESNGPLLNFHSFSKVRSSSYCAWHVPEHPREKKLRQRLSFYLRLLRTATRLKDSRCLIPLCNFRPDFKVEGSTLCAEKHSIPIGMDVPQSSVASGQTFSVAYDLLQSESTLTAAPLTPCRSSQNKRIIYL
jgi:hypothetical protein